MANEFKSGAYYWVRFSNLEALNTQWFPARAYQENGVWLFSGCSTPTGHYIWPLSLLEIGTEIACPLPQRPVRTYVSPGKQKLAALAAQW